MDTLDNLIGIQVTFWHSANTSGSKIRVLWLDTPQTTKLLVSRLYQLLAVMKNSELLFSIWQLDYDQLRPQIDSIHRVLLIWLVAYKIVHKCIAIVDGAVEIWAM
jgi:hypothetical protein